MRQARVCRLCQRAPGTAVYQKGSRGKQRIGTVRSLSRHHLVPKGQGGDDLDANLVPLCGHGTAGCHGEVEHKLEARARLRPQLRADELAYVVEKRGVAWLDKRYPSADLPG